MQDDEGLRAAHRTNVHDENAGQSCIELNTEQFMNGRREVVIVHNGERYRLRITSKQRLILTK